MCSSSSSSPPTPKEENRSVEECGALVKEVAKAVSHPLMVNGCGSEEKDAKLMEAVSNSGRGERLFLGLAQEGGGMDYGMTREEGPYMFDETPRPSSKILISDCL